jgi:Family of unknown function (DUF6088)
MIKRISISNILQRQVATMPEGEILTYPILAEGQSELAFFKALSRMVQTGELVRIEKGKYYKPKKTRFGSLRPSEEEILKSLTQRAGKTIGYLTGKVLYNRWGLTTQVTNVLTIARRSRLPQKELSGYKIKFVVRPFAFKETDIPLLQLLDALTDIRKIPDTSPAKVIPTLAEKIINLQETQIKRMCILAMEYSPSTRALLGALLEANSLAQGVELLRNSLNPLTKYKLKGIENILPNKAKWQFI